MDVQWSRADQQRNPVNDCHEMIQDAKGRIFLLTNETKNNVLVYNTSGKLLNNWGHEFPGAHGLSLADENGEQFLFITDTSKNQVYKTTLDGRVLLTIDAPLDAGIYKEKKQFVPTEVTIDESTGDFFIADGYGAQYVLHYDAKGIFKGYFGGRGEGDKFLDNAHGICIDQRDGRKTLLVTDRTRNCFKRFSMTGELLDIISIPGACVCRPVIRNKHLYAAVLRSPVISKEGSGFVTILDQNNKVVSNIGGTEPWSREKKYSCIRMMSVWTETRTSTLPNGPPARCIRISSSEENRNPTKTKKAVGYPTAFFYDQFFTLLFFPTKNQVHYNPGQQVT
jgi:hypothetical protein